MGARAPQPPATKPAGMSPEDSPDVAGPCLAHIMCSIDDPILQRGSHTPGWESGCFSPPRRQSHLPRAPQGGGGLFLPRVSGPSTPNSCHLVHKIPRDHSPLLLQTLPWLHMWLRVKVQTLTTRPSKPTRPCTVFPPYTSAIPLPYSLPAPLTSP